MNLLIYCFYRFLGESFGYFWFIIKFLKCSNNFYLFPIIKRITFLFPNCFGWYFQHNCHSLVESSWFPTMTQSTMAHFSPSCYWTCFANIHKRGWSMGLLFLDHYTGLLGLSEQNATDCMTYIVYFLTIWKLKVWYQGVGRLISSEILSWTCRWLPSCCVFTWLHLCMYMPGIPLCPNLLFL